MKIAELKPAEYNPRKISAEQLQRLKLSLEKFGDLSGIVFNRRTGHLVGGHQRMSLLPQDAIIEKTDLNSPTGSGTVAQGFIMVNGERLVYREVDWPIDVEKAANIAANKHGGDWDDDKLNTLLADLADEGTVGMEVIGFSEEEYQKIISMVDETQEGHIKKNFTSGYGGSDEADAATEQLVSGISKYPVTFILTKPDWDKWQRIKEQHGKKDDKTVFLKIIGGL